LATFNQLGVSEVFAKALQENNFHTPTEIQSRVIPFLLDKGTDLVAQAQTGTGKTAAFGLPLLQKCSPDKEHVQALVLTPTRELGQQIAKQLFKLTKYGPKIFTEAVYGGAPIGDQIKALMRPTQIIVATPGRLIDLLDKKAVDISNVKTIVLDEADEMLSMGFKDELEQILSRTKGKRNIWLFSATMPPEIKTIIKAYMMPDAMHVQVDKKNIVNTNIEHRFIETDDKEKLDMLVHFLKVQGENRGVIFCRTKNGAQLLAKQLTAKNFVTDSIHGDLMQKERDKVMRAFKGLKIQILIATDLAARGIDVENLAYVVHYDLPEQLEYYTHRSGRTARAGKTGISLCLVGPRDIKRMQGIESSLGIKIKPMKI
jgi:ATP-dependent RNA helicase DeaD